MSVHGKQLRDGTVAPGKGVGSVTVAYSGAPTLDLKEASDFQIGALTGNCSIFLSNAAAGRKGTIAVQQDSAGNRTVSFTVSGYTVYSADPDSPSLVADPGANAVTLYQYELRVVGALSLAIFRRFCPIPTMEPPPLPASIIEYWDARQGVNRSGTTVLSWTGQHRGIVLWPVGGTIQYGVDGAHFGGKPVVQCSSTAGMRAVLDTALPASKHATVSVARYRTLTMNAGTWGLIGLGVPATSDNHYIYHTGDTAQGNFKSYGANTQFATVSLLATDSNVHTFVLRRNATRISLLLDGALDFVDNTGGGINGAPTAISLGCGASGNYHFSPSSHGFHMLCSVEPTAAELAALDAWLRSSANWSAPLPKTAAQLFGSKIKLDLDGDVGVTTSIGKVTTWTDQSPQGNTVTQTTSANRPTVAAGGLDGHSAVRFAAASSQLMTRVNTFTGYALGDQPRYYVVALWTDGALFDIGTDVTYDSGNAIWGNGDNTIWCDYRNTNFSIRGVTGAQLPAASAQLWDISSTLGTLNSMVLRRNTTVLLDTNAAAATPGAPDTMVLGRRGGASSYLTGDIYRFLILNANPTADEHTTMLAYLRGRYPSLAL